MPVTDEQRSDAPQIVTKATEQVLLGALMPSASCPSTTHLATYGTRPEAYDIIRLTVLSDAG